MQADNLFRFEERLKVGCIMKCHAKDLLLSTNYRLNEPLKNQATENIYWDYLNLIFRGKSTCFCDLFSEPILLRYELKTN
jgi:hypothetical protein